MPFSPQSSVHTIHTLTSPPLNNKSTPLNSSWWSLMSSSTRHLYTIQRMRYEIPKISTSGDFIKVLAFLLKTHTFEEINKVVPIWTANSVIWNDFQGYCKNNYLKSFGCLKWRWRCHIFQNKSIYNYYHYAWLCGLYPNQKCSGVLVPV